MFSYKSGQGAKLSLQICKTQTSNTRQGIGSILLFRFVNYGLLVLALLDLLEILVPMRLLNSVGFLLLAPLLVLDTLRLQIKMDARTQLSILFYYNSLTFNAA